MNKAVTIWLAALLVIASLGFTFVILHLNKTQNTLELQVDQLTVDNKKLQESIIKMNTDLEAKDFENNRKLKSLEDSNQTLKQELNILEKENKQLQSIKEQLENKTKTLEKQLEAKAKSNGALASTVEKPNNQNNSQPNQNTPKIAYVTFDDGPSDNTIAILNTLKSYGIKATFFVNGSSTEKSKSIYRRIANEGHALGNHTYSHDYSYIYKNKDNYFKDHDKMSNVLKDTVGYAPKIVRFPGGSNNTVSHKYGYKGLTKEIADSLKSQGYVFFDWNVDSTDASVSNQKKEVIIDSVLKQTKNKKTAIILFHDSKGKKSTADALPTILDGLIEQGYTFKALDQTSPAPQFIYKIYK